MIIKMSLQHFGGRGGASGISAGGGVNYLSADKTLFSEEPVKVTSTLDTTSGYVVSATTDENGNLTLHNARYDEYERISRKYHTAKYTVSQGITRLDENGDVIDTKSVGINWDAVKSVSGKTYEVKEFIKSKGFKWDKDAYQWRRPNDVGTGGGEGSKKSMTSLLFGSKKW